MRERCYSRVKNLGRALRKGDKREIAGVKIIWKRKP